MDGLGWVMFGLVWLLLVWVLSLLFMERFALFYMSHCGYIPYP